MLSSNNPATSVATQPTVEASVSHHFHERLIEAITKYQELITPVDLTSELLDAYAVVLNSKEYTSMAEQNLLFTIKEVLLFTAELQRLVNHFSQPQNEAA